MVLVEGTLLQMTIFNQLKQLQEHCYAPYSKYPVAVIVIDNKGNQYAGVNVENAAFPVGICAEKAAISAAVTNGVKELKELHLICGTGTEFGSPCGSCRQFISEFMDKNAPVFIYNINGEVKEFTVSQLLPFGFEKKNLGE